MGCASRGRPVCIMYIECTICIARDWEAYRVESVEWLEQLQSIRGSLSMARGVNGVADSGWITVGEAVPLRSPPKIQNSATRQAPQLCAALPTLLDLSTYHHHHHHQHVRNVVDAQR